MKVILLQDVKSLGKKDDIVDVSDGYAKNFLFTKKLGVEANSKNMNDLKLKKANNEKVAAQNLQDAKDLAELIAGKTVVVRLKAGEGGKTFGSVSNKEISEEAKAQGKNKQDEQSSSVDVSGFHENSPSVIRICTCPERPHTQPSRTIFR